MTPDQKHTVVTGCVVQTGEIGLINTPADFKALYIDINPDRGLHFNRTIDFTQQFANRGGAKPHSSVVFDLTDPANPEGIENKGEFGNRFAKDFEDA